ncbi:TPA: hypothetical protein EYP70_04370 [Candidatus Bathyarchaeota archaeon]|nr:hypothetical protein [Candidatus Bathyarchaeota archaeon]
MLEAKRYPIRIGKGSVSWESEVHESSERDSPSDILGFIYPHASKGDAVVMDKRVVSMFRDRLKSLEEENEHLRNRIRLMEFLAGGLIVAISLLIWLLAGFFQIYP